MTAVLDSWAVLGYLEGAEPAAGLVAALLGQGRTLMSWVNLGEVHYVLRRAHGEEAAVETTRDLRDVLDTRLPDEQLVLDAARIKADPHPGLRVAALAVAERADLWTGDPQLLVDGARWSWRDLRTG